MILGTPIAKGNTATIYLWDQKIIKVFHDYLPDNEASYEAEKQMYVYSLGVTVPKIIDVTKIDGRQAIVMEHVKGKTIGELLMEDEGKTDYYMNVSVDEQLKIHQISPDSLEPMSDKLARQIEAAPILDISQKTALLKKLGAFTYKKRLCHGDFHVYNLIMTPTDVAIIDWVDSSAGDVRADVYRTYLLYLQVSADLAELYLHLYCEKSSLSKEEILQWAPIIAAARLSEHVTSENSERLVGIINHYLTEGK
ncbi:phosphotransferase family protein [Ornithinibacillus xuwenensis]|uniref:Aminoglycoside phosphotransferase family protein n=1 Tax=Ornithinibacillus xuwenensis TaxID=3144668 RepID=A0ABU9XLJ8_9BACI